jgi:hypothetical protein
VVMRGTRRTIGLARLARLGCMARWVHLAGVARRIGLARLDCVARWVRLAGVARRVGLARLSCVARVVSVVLAVVPACQSVRADAGLSAELRVAGAQFVAGDLASAAPVGGPAVVSVFNSLTAVTPGERAKPLSGALAPTATAAALGLQGDAGYWIVVAGPPQLDAPELPTFQATLSFSPQLPLGPLALLVRAVDAGGRFGAPAAVPLASAPPPPPSGSLVVSLRWDTEADLDLHVITPAGVEIWAGNINSYQLPPPGTPADAAAWQSGGLLDCDSNAGCVIDGRRQENVVWQAPPPAGSYLVRVDTASLCAAPDARWTVEVLESGVPVASSQGESLTTDTRFSQGPGSGLQALAFDVPPP